MMRLLPCLPRLERIRTGLFSALKPILIEGRFEDAHLVGGGCLSNKGQEFWMAEIIILAERRKARQERRATNVMAMPFALMAAYMAFGAATYAAIVEASQQSYKR